MFKKSKFSILIDSIIPVILIGIITAFIVLSNTYINKVQERYTKGFISILESLIETGCTPEGLTEASITLVERIDQMEGKGAAIYILNEKLMYLTAITNGESFKHYLTRPNYEESIMSALENEQEGFFQVNEDGIRWHVHFKWIQNKSSYHKYLILYAVDQSLFEQPLVQLLRYISVFLFMSYWLKITLYDRNLYTKILRDIQNRSFTKTEYTKLEASMYNNDDIK